jgi:hypothetical protein
MSLIGRRMLLAAAIVFTVSRAGAAADLPGLARTFITEHCTECHDSDLKKGDLDLTALGTQLDDPVLEARWVLAYDRVQRGEMPPKKKALPPTERLAFLESLGGFLADHDAARQAVAGRVVLRRLNRVEYENTVHDLLKIDTPLADLLPEDAAADGFDNVAQALRLSAAQIDGYLEAADKALDAAIDLRPDPRMNKRLSFLDIPEIRDALDMPFGSVKADGTRIERNFTSLGDAFILYVNETYGPTTMRESHVPVSGTYRVRISMFAYQSTGHPVVVARWMANNFITSRTLAELDLTPGQPRVAEFTAWMNQGEMLMLSASGLSIPAPDGSNLRDAESFKGQGLGVNWVQIEGPLADTWPPPSVAQVFGDVKVEPVAAKKKNDKRAYEIVPAEPAEDADRVIEAFARRAFRRPVSDDDVARYTQLAHEALAQGATFENAVRSSLRRSSSSCRRKRGCWMITPWPRA